MTDEEKSKQQLIAELQQLRAQIERLESETNNINAKQEWEEIFDTINDAITIHDADFNIIRANKAAVEMLGLPFFTILKQKCFQSYHGTGCPPDGCPSCSSLKTGIPSVSKIFEPHLNKHLEIKALPRFDKNNIIIGLIHIVKDITEQVKAEEEQKKLQSQFLQSQKMEAIGTLAGGVAHDFNNILTAIIGFGTMALRRIQEDEASKEYLLEIINGAKRAAELTQRLLAFSRKQTIELRQLDLNSIVERVQKMLGRIIGEDIELKTMLNSEDIAVNADAGQIEQVLLNLATNARDAMPNGGVLTIQTSVVDIDSSHAEAQLFEKTGQYAMLIVSDTGIGMDVKTKDNIFEPFFTTKEVGKGTGLGLAVVYGIVKQHGGHISVDSSTGLGTTLTIYLPIAITPYEDQIENAQPIPSGKGECILLCEDDAQARKITRIYLEEYRYKVIEAGNGDEAVKRFVENKDSINLVIMDVIMPIKNGKAAYEEIKALRQDIKVLYISGYTDEIIAKRGILQEEVDFLSKPIPPDKLLGKIRSMLDSQ
ncbi:MAG: response regulator [Nitrospirae bacterium]|nr:response regulator [Nitrospirota bacterium]